MYLSAIHKSNAIKASLVPLTKLVGLSLFSLISLTVHAEPEECYDSKFGLTYASDTSRYVNVSDGLLDKNAALKSIRLRQHHAHFSVLNQSGQTLFDKIYNILVYSDGYILAKKDGQFGLIDNNGRLVHDFKYDAIERLNDGQTIVSRYHEGQLSDVLIDAQGQRIYPVSEAFESSLRITGVYYDHDAQKGYFQIVKEGKSGLIDDTGKTVIPIIYDEMEGVAYCNGREFVMKVRLGGKIGLITYNNKFVIPLSANQSITSFNTNDYEPYILSLQKSKKSAVTSLNWQPNKADVTSEQLMTPTGEILVTSSSPIRNLGSDLYKFSKNDKVGIINSWADIVLGAYYDDILYEYDSPLIAQRAGKFGILNTDQSGRTLKVRYYFDSLERINNDEFITAATDTTSLEEADTVVIIEGGIDAEKYERDDFIIDQIFTENDREYFASNSFEYKYYNSRSPQAYIVSSQDKYGVVSSYNNNQIIVPLDYDAIEERGEILVVEQAGKYGVLDAQGNIVQPIVFDAIQEFDNNRDFFILSKGNQQAIMNSVGDIVFDLSDVRLRVDMMAYAIAPIPIEKNGFFGYLNQARTAVAIEPTYETLELIYGGDKFVGQKNGRKQLRNFDNSIIEVSRSSDYHILDDAIANDERSFIVTLAGKKGVINTDGDVLLPFDYDAIESFLTRRYDQEHDNYGHERYFIVKKEGLYGLLDKNLKPIILPTYKYFARLKSHPYFVIASKNKSDRPVKYGLIDVEGDIVQQMQYDTISIDPNDDEYIILRKGAEKQYYSEKIELGLDVVVSE